MYKQCVVLVALLGTSFAMSRAVSPRIVGGAPTNITRYPFMSNMQLNYLGIWWFQACGGSLITTTAVLSASHCYQGYSPSSWRVRLGTSYASEGGSIHAVKELIIHPDFDSDTMDNDPAIVRLATPAMLSHNVKLARIAGVNYNLPDGAAVAAVGWGTLSPGGSSPEILQHVSVNVVNQEICAERYAQLKNTTGFEGWPDVTPGMLCAGILDEGGKDACQGDSGGPLVHDGDVVVGITSWGYSCAHKNYPGVNARVSHYAVWITTTANNN